MPRRLLPALVLWMLLPLAGCAAPAVVRPTPPVPPQPVAVEPVAPVLDGVTPLTVEQDRQLSR